MLFLNPPLSDQKRIPVSKVMKSRFFLLAMMVHISAFSLAPALADDTEIYTGDGNNNSAAKPNLTFIIDTSGSMDTDETITNGVYDPSQTYTGTCDTARIYWSTRGRVPTCSTNQYVVATANKCAASASALSSGGAGFYSTRVARYKPGSTRRRRTAEATWDTLSTSDHDSPVECNDDFGIHGETDASTDLYPADEGNGGPWRADTTGAVNWARTGDNYTLYSANYLNWRESGAGAVTKTRLEIVQEVFSNLMDSISNLNISVMRFSTNAQGGYFIMPMSELTSANRADYKSAVNGLTASGYTPLSETLYESYLFYKGANADYGTSSTPATNVAGVQTGNRYNSPIDYQCQKNFVILLTDGEPTQDTDANSNIQALPGFSTLTGAASCSGNCLDELAQYMNGKDCSALTGKQNVITYTIGFTTDQVLLSNTATKGGGKYFTASGYTDLTDAFNAIINDIRETNDSFVAPAVSVNSFNRFTHRDELFYALFRPDLRPKWGGNIKRYKLDGNPPVIVDKDGVDAINPSTGFFKSSATSYWTTGADAPDGENVLKGGAASLMTNSRTVYTYVGASAPADVDLTQDSSQLVTANADITKTLLGDAAMSDTDRTNLINWTRGVDVLNEDADDSDTDARHRMGDPLHAKPVLVTYAGPEATPDITLFVGTNEGQLHAINAQTGQEYFSFVPKELLPNLSLIYENAAATSHPYGLDGPLSVWFKDDNHNGLLLTGGGSIETNEHVYLYQAMRRGGRNIYALDVSNRSAPVLKWVIYGGTGDFAELGQTWSRATHAKIKLNGVDKDVLIFAGGYDTNQDSNTLAEDDSVGRAMFIVDASTGAKLWQAGPAGSGNGGADPDLVLAEMTNSIPSDVTIIDSNFDGYADLLFVGDMRGQVWRFDIHNLTNSGASNLVSAGVVARFGGATAAENRRFYYKPDVSLSNDGKKWNIAIGSGYRAHPLGTAIHDAMYVFQDANVYSPALDGDGNPVYTALTMANLYNATSNIIAEGNQAQINAARTALAAASGFYIYMAEQNGSYVGEKVLAKSITVQGKLMFTTYTPVNNGVSACAPGTGTARIYYVSIADGTPLVDANASGGDLTWADRRIDLDRGGIPPEPSVIFNRNGPVVLVGTEHGPTPEQLLRPIKTFWHE